MKVADKNHDEKISKAELMFAMQSWYGYTHLDENFAHLFEAYDTDHNQHLDATELQGLLTELNDRRPVDLETAKAVIANADVMGDGRIGKFELLGAVGLWYV